MSHGSIVRCRELACPAHGIPDGVTSGSRNTHGRDGAPEGGAGDTQRGGDGGTNTRAAGQRLDGQRQRDEMNARRTYKLHKLHDNVQSGVKRQCGCIVSIVRYAEGSEAVACSRLPHSPTKVGPSRSNERAATVCSIDNGTSRQKHDMIPYHGRHGAPR